MISSARWERFEKCGDARTVRKGVDEQWVWVCWSKNRAKERRDIVWAWAEYRLRVYY